MGELGEGSLLDKLPAWFVKYVQEQQGLSAATRETKRLRIAKDQKEAKEARLRMIRNDNKLGKALPSLLEYYGDVDKLEAWL